MGKGHTIQVNLNVEPWMRKYLEVELGPQPFKITMDHYEGKVLFANLCGKKCEVKGWTRKPGMEIFSLQIPWKYMHQWGLVDMPEENVEHFVEHQQRKFKRQLILWVESRITLDEKLRKQIQIKDAILSFCEKFKIPEDDIPYETLKKIVYRALGAKNKVETIIT